ncbi:hypothetical protein Mapa_011096 [Marchantia paleacea]|nr:hypothetical protein Mapa_011096 [Marchantia paleacea]
MRRGLRPLAAARFHKNTLPPLSPTLPYLSLPLSYIFPILSPTPSLRSAIATLVLPPTSPTSSIHRFLVDPGPPSFFRPLHRTFSRQDKQSSTSSSSSSTAARFLKTTTPPFLLPRSLSVTALSQSRSPLSLILSQRLCFSLSLSLALSLSHLYLSRLHFLLPFVNSLFETNPPRLLLLSLTLALSSRLSRANSTMTKKEVERANRRSQSCPSSFFLLFRPRRDSRASLARYKRRNRPCVLLPLRTKL